MTVAELRKAIEGLPDEMIVASLDAGGYTAWDFVIAKVVTVNDPADRYPEPARPYFMVSS